MLLLLYTSGAGKLMNKIYDLSMYREAKRISNELTKAEIHAEIIRLKNYYSSNCMTDLDIEEDNAILEEVFAEYISRSIKVHTIAFNMKVRRERDEFAENKLL